MPILKRRTTHTLNAADQELAVWAGRARYEANRKAGNRDNRTEKDYTLEELFHGDRDAVAGEIAFARLANLELPELVLEVWIGTIDLTLPDGRTVDAKHTNWRNGKILSNRRAKRIADLYVSMKGRYPDLYYDGYAPKEVLIRPDNLRFWDYTNPCYVLSRLEVIDDLEWEDGR